MKDMKDDETILVGELWGALNTMRDVHRDAMRNVAPDHIEQHGAGVYGAIELLRAAGVITEETDERLSKDWARMLRELKERREVEARLDDVVSGHLDPKDLWADMDFLWEFCRGCTNDGHKYDGDRACGIEPCADACSRREDWEKIEAGWAHARRVTIDVLRSRLGGKEVAAV